MIVHRFDQLKAEFAATVDVLFGLLNRGDTDAITNKQTNKNNSPDNEINNNQIE